MPVEKMVLVVSTTPGLADAAVKSALRCGYTPVVAHSFAEAKQHLGSPLHLLVTELKLGDYNGLHLALHAKLHDVPAIVIADSSYEREIEQFGAVWISPSMTISALPPVMVGLVQGPLARATFGWSEAANEGDVAVTSHASPPVQH